MEYRITTPPHPTAAERASRCWRSNYAPCLAAMLLYLCGLSPMFSVLSTQWRAPNQHNSAGWERVADHLASATHH
jgi:hypothetical protein